MPARKFSNNVAAEPAATNSQHQNKVQLPFDYQESSNKAAVQNPQNNAKTTMLTVKKSEIVAFEGGKTRDDVGDNLAVITNSEVKNKIVKSTQSS